MFIKILGSIIVIFSSILFALSFLFKEKYRIEELEGMKQALQILKSNLTYSNMPLFEAMKEISLKSEKNLKEFFYTVSKRLEERNGKTAFEIWEDTIHEMCKDLYFTSEDLSTFISFGKNLGSIDIRLHEENIQSTIDYIDYKILNLKSKKQKDLKMYKSLGLLGGILIVVILL